VTPRDTTPFCYWLEPRRFRELVAADFLVLLSHVLLPHILLLPFVVAPDPTGSISANFNFRGGRYSGSFFLLLRTLFGGPFCLTHKSCDPPGAALGPCWVTWDKGQTERPYLY